MVVGADTTLVIDFLNGDPNAIAALRQHDIVLNTISYFEATCTKMTQTEKEAVEEFFTILPTVGLQLQEAKMAGNIYQKRQSKGRTIPKRDSLIIGTYLANGITKILTRDVKHFSEIEEIEVIQY